MNRCLFCNTAAEECPDCDNYLTGVYGLDVTDPSNAALVCQHCLVPWIETGQEPWRQREKLQ